MLCVLAKLDPEATEKLNSLRRAALPGGCAAPLYGHITVAACIGDDEAGFVRACAPMIRTVRPFSVRYRAVSILSETSIIAAIPEASGSLLRLHSRIAARFGPVLDRWTCGADWVPHTTLLYGPDEDLYGICERMRKEFIPFQAEIRSIVFSKVLEHGFSILEQIRLG